MSAPPEVIAAFDAAIPGHSGVEDWYGIGATGAHWRTTWRGLAVSAFPQAEGVWDARAYLPERIGGQGYGFDNDLTAALRAAKAKAARVAIRCAERRRLQAARRIASATAVEAMAAQWGQP